MAPIPLPMLPAPRRSRLRRHATTAAALALSSLAAFAGPGPESSRPPAALQRDDARLDNALDAHIRFLADDLLEGRGAASTGHEIAARYVAGQFRQFGLAPGANAGSWFQEVPLLESRLVPESPRLQLRIADATLELEHNLDFVAAPRLAGTNDSVTAPLTFAGFGVHAPELGHDDFAGLDLRGRIAVVVAKAPPRFPATALAHHSHRNRKAAVLSERGAVGILTIPTQKDLEETPWASTVRRAQFPVMRWTTPDGQPTEAFPSLRATVSLSPRGAGRIFTNSPVPLADVLAGAARGELKGFDLRAEATLHVESVHRRTSSPNVLGILPGRDPRLRNEAVILTAHLDHQGRGPAIDGDSIYNGAYDNAIGTAMMLEVARHFASARKAPRRTLVFAAVTAEEKGLVGSDYLAQHLPAALGRPVANVNLDMVLVTRPTRQFTVLGIEHSSLRDPVTRAARQLRLELLPDPRPDRVSFVRSDQYSFIRQGIPAIAPKVADTGTPPNSATELTPDAYVKNHYHKPSDDLSLPRDAASSVRFTRFMIEVVRQVADADQAPAWNPGDFFGTTFGRR